MTAFRAVLLVAALAIAAGLDTRASNASAGLTAECTVEALQARAPHGTTITAAAVVPSTATLPEHCRVDGHVAAPGNEVNFRLAPTSIIASHATDDVVDRTRPLCPYPQIAKYTGTGSIDDAANFHCVAR
jgi:hypothetical protein